MVDFHYTEKGQEKSTPCPIGQEKGPSDSLITTTRYSVQTVGGRQARRPGTRSSICCFGLRFGLIHDVQPVLRKIFSSVQVAMGRISSKLASAERSKKHQDENNQ